MVGLVCPGCSTCRRCVLSTAAGRSGWLCGVEAKVQICDVPPLPRHVQQSQEQPACFSFWVSWYVADLFTLVKLSRPTQFCHFMLGCLLQTGSLFLLYLESRAEFSLISIGTRCVPKHTSVARKKLPNKESDYNITRNIVRGFKALNIYMLADQAVQTTNLRAFLAGLWRITSSHSAPRNKWGLIILLMKSYLF